MTKPAGNRYYRGPISDHFDGHRFFNPGHPSTDRSFADTLRWKRGARPAPWPTTVPSATTVPQSRVDALRVTMVGHATALIQAAGINVVTDPVWSARASPLGFMGPRRVTAPGVAFDDLPTIDVILLSHNHYDHLDIATLRRLQARDRPLIVTPLGNDSIIRRHLPDARIAAADWGECVVLPGGAQAHVVPAHHWSARGPRDRRMALWGGFMLRMDNALVYFAGDTGYGDGAIFRAMRHRHGAADMALIPIGAYAPRWFMAAQHVDPDEAVCMFNDLGARQGIGIHWGTFPLTNEPREEPVAKLAAALAQAGIAPERFRAAAPGDLFQAVP